MQNSHSYSEKDSIQFYGLGEETTNAIEEYRCYTRTIGRDEYDE